MQDCLVLVFNYLPLTDRVRSQRVCRFWCHVLRRSHTLYRGFLDRPGDGNAFSAVRDLFLSLTDQYQQCLMLYALPPAPPSRLSTVYQRKVLLREDVDGAVCLPLCSLLRELGILSRDDLLKRFSVAFLEEIGTPHGVRSLYRKLVSLDECFAAPSVMDLRQKLLSAR